MKWDKNTFMADMREKCSREIAKIGNSICEFSEQHAADISWGRGNDHGTLTYRCDFDEEMYPTDTFEPMNELFHTSNQVEKFLKTIEGCTYRLKQ